MQDSDVGKILCSREKEIHHISNIYIYIYIHIRTQSYTYIYFETTCLLARIMTAPTEVQSNLCRHLAIWHLVPFRMKDNLQSLYKYIPKYTTVFGRQCVICKVEHAFILHCLLHLQTDCGMSEARPRQCILIYKSGLGLASLALALHHMFKPQI